MAEDELSAHAMALSHLRRKKRWSQEKLAGALGFAGAELIGRYERDEKTLTRENLDELVKPLRYPEEAVDVLLFADRLLSAVPSEEAASPVALLPEERARIHRTVMNMGWAVAERFLAALPRHKRQEKVAEAERRAEELWAVLQPCTPEDRRKLVETFPQFRHWGLVRLVCAASEQAAGHRVEAAGELADFAVFLAERVPGEEAFRSSLKAYALGHLANSRRVADDLNGAAGLFVQVWDLWRSPAAAEFLPEWRLLDLEASLRRDQHLFAEALSLLDRALAACGDDPAEAARIWLKKEHVFDTQGDTRSALAALEQAAPLVERSGNAQLLFALRFNTVDTLLRLGRYEKAAVAELRELATELRNDLHLVRVSWLGARIDAGLGRKDEAIAAMEYVFDELTHRELPYEGALAGLDLALLWLEAGRAAEVRELALRMRWVFEAQRIHREALVSLSLFWEAAEEETATVALARRAIADLERERGPAPRSAGETEGRA